MGKKELEGQDERNTRYRIRQRIDNSLRDISTLNGHVSDNDLEQIANNHPDYYTRETCQSLIRLAYKLLIRHKEIDHPLDTLEQCIGMAVARETASRTEVEDGARIFSAQVSIDQSSQELTADLLDRVDRELRANDSELGTLNWLYQQSPRISGDFDQVDEELLEEYK